MPHPKVAMLDPSAFTPPYDRSLAAALARAGAEVELITSRFIYGPVPEAEGYGVTELFYHRATGLPSFSRLRIPLKAAEHIPGMLAARALIRSADVAHWQWVTYPPLDRHLLGRNPKQPRVITLHYPLPDPGDARALASQRKFLSRFDAVISHTESGAERLRADVGLAPATVHVIPHGPFDYLTELPDPEPLPDELAAVEGPVVLFFGLLRPYKGIDALLEAFGRLGETDAELWIAGMPRMQIEELQELAEGLPTFLVFHHPTYVIKDDESAGPDPDLDALIERHHDTIQAIFVGHTHRWIDLSHVYDIPHVVLGATRYDEDNFWVAELTEGTSDWRLLDEDKAVWNSVEGRAFDYEALSVAE